MRLSIAIKFILPILVATAALFAIVIPRAHGAVPVWTVGFDINTDLSAFLYYLNLHERAQKLADIEKAREDVNKLIYETFVELRDEPLLLEFHRIRESCSKAFSLDKQLCWFIDEVESALKTRGITIESRVIAQDPDNPDVTIQSEDTLCAGGVKTSEGCLLIKKEARIIRNPDEFIFEEPRQKARDFIMCYLAPWKHFPLDTEQPDEVRDALKAHLLFKYSRKQKWLQTAPPESWYTKGRCELIMAQFTCPPFDAVQKTGGTISPNIPGTLEVNIDNVCAFSDVEKFPTLAKALGDDWEYQELAQATQNPNNTLVQLKELMETTIEAIIAQGEQLRQAEYVAGQGLRAEKYNIGFQDSGEKAYYVETENVITPAVILLQKLQAAAQAQFDLASKAFKQVEEGERVEESVRFTTDGTPGAVGPTDIQLYRPDLGQLPRGDEQYTQAGLPAPFEDRADYANLEKAAPGFKDLENRGGQISSLDPIYENYFNEHYRDILEMHKNTFANTIARWFTQEAADGKPPGRQIPLLPGRGGPATSTPPTAGSVEVCGETSTIQFGEVPVGSSQTEICSIINNSDQAVTLSFSLNPPDIPFSLSTNQISLDPNGSASLEVTFSPTEPVLYGTRGLAGIDVDFDNQDLSIPRRINLFGKGVEQNQPGPPPKQTSLPEINSQSTQSELLSFYNAANEQLFNGELVTLRDGIIWQTPRGVTQGECAGQYGRVVPNGNFGMAGGIDHPVQITLNPGCFSSTDSQSLQGTLLHEMIHVLIEQQPGTQSGHPASFCQKALEIGESTGLTDEILKGEAQTVCR